jgi:hypothetical protein
MFCAIGGGLMGDIGVSPCEPVASTRSAEMAARRRDRVSLDHGWQKKFPGFATDIHGLVSEETTAGTRYYMDCVPD